MNARRSSTGSRAPSGLEAAQRWFLGAVTDLRGVRAGGESCDAHLTRSSRLGAEDRLAIYGRAYFARLIECLGGCFPALKRALGEELFDGFAAGYLERHPSRSYTLGRLGERFSEYLRETRPAELRGADWPDLLIDLAALEWAIDEVFDGPGVEGRKTLQPDDVMRIPPERWPGLRLKTVPCLRLLRFRFPMNDYYGALKRGDDAAVPAPPRRGDSSMVLTRRDFIVRRQEISLRQFELLSALQQGQPISAAIARAAGSCGLDDAALAGHLHDWFASWARLELFEAVIEG